MLKLPLALEAATPVNQRRILFLRHLDRRGLYPSIGAAVVGIRLLRSALDAADDGLMGFVNIHILGRDLDPRLEVAKRTGEILLRLVAHQLPR